jgi:hypothetical protein
MNVKTLRLLALLEHSPKYAQQIARLAPDVFDSKQRAGKTVGLPYNDGKIYQYMARVVGQGLVKRLPNYIPPATVEVPKRSLDRIVWYGITSTGRKALREAREAISGATAC